MPISKQDVVQTVGQFCPSLFKRTLNYCWGKTKISSSCLKWASNAGQDGFVPVLSRLAHQMQPMGLICKGHPALVSKQRLTCHRGGTFTLKWTKDDSLSNELCKHCKGLFTLKWTLQALRRTLTVLHPFNVFIQHLRSTTSSPYFECKI